MQWRQFAWNVKLKNEKNISKCLLKILLRVLRKGLHKHCAREYVYGKTNNKICMKSQVSRHTLSLHISSLIRAFANQMYLLWLIDCVGV